MESYETALEEENLVGWSGWSLEYPQGLMLGPILFLIFKDVVDNGLHSSVLKFANDK